MRELIIGILLVICTLFVSFGDWIYEHGKLKYYYIILSLLLFGCYLIFVNIIKLASN